MTEFSHRLRVRYSECDAQGIVFNGHYLFYYDVALTELFRHHGWTWPQVVAMGTDIVVAESTLRYLGPARFDQLVDIAMPVVRLGTTSMVIEPRFCIDGAVVADGSVRHVFVDPRTWKPTPIPDPVRAALSGA